jgi:hypothetical protein
VGAAPRARVPRRGASCAAPGAAGQPGPCSARPARPPGSLCAGVLPGAAGKNRSCVPSAMAQALIPR